MNGLNHNIGLLLLILAICLSYPHYREFTDWFKRRYAIMKRCQYRRAALRTNLKLYKDTGEDYYIERVKELGK